MSTGQHMKLMKHRKRVGKMYKNTFAETAPRWKGDGAGYAAKHVWLNLHWDKEACDHCGVKKEDTKEGTLDWANISKQYKRDRDDFLVLCRRCHRRYDMTNMCKKKLHEFTPENTITRKRPLASGLPKRECRACLELRMQKGAKK